MMDLFDYLGIVYVVAPYEADAQLAYCCSQNMADFVISEDSDLLVYGCKNLVLKIDYEGNCESITLQKTLADKEFIGSNNDSLIKDLVNFSHEKFTELCIFAGCDTSGPQ